MERTITVTINLNKNGEASFNFLDCESGDDVTYCTTIGEKNADVAECVGGELMSWLELMADSMDDINDDEEDLPMNKIDLEENWAYAAKYGVSDIYDEADQKLREAIASGEDFDTKWFGSRKEINYARIHREHGELEVEVTAHMDDLFDGHDLIYDALWEVARTEDELPEDIIDSIVDEAIDCEIDDKTECNVFLPANASYDDVCKALDECEASAMATNHEMYERLKEIVKEHWDHMKEQEGKQ